MKTTPQSLLGKKVKNNRGIASGEEGEDEKRSGGVGCSQYLLSLPKDRYADEMEQREAASWVEFVIVGQGRKYPVCNE